MNDALPRPPPSPPERPPPLSPSLEPKSEATLRAMLEHMIGSRALEERVVELYRLGRISGGCYTGIGNEATSVGLALAMGDADVVIPTHRDMGVQLVFGHDALIVLRQYLKKATSLTRGKDTGLHLGVEGGRVVGTISPLAHMLSVACGVALADRLQGRSTAVLATFGDGSSSHGEAHEALNFAAVQRLPVLFVVENNQYAYSTPTTLQYACARLSDRAVGYGMRGETVDGTDVFAVHAAAVEALNHARAGRGPTLLECVTMRMRGHSEHDDFRYVPPALLERWRRWDPIERLITYLSDRPGFSPAALRQLRAAKADEIERALAQAEAEPAPDPASAGADVFRRWERGWTAPSGGELEEGREPWRS